MQCNSKSDFILDVKIGSLDKKFAYDIKYKRKYYMLINNKEKQVWNNGRILSSNIWNKIKAILVTGCGVLKGGQKSRIPRSRQ
jgi:hypothetical protein